MIKLLMTGKLTSFLDLKNNEIKVEKLKPQIGLTDE